MVHGVLYNSFSCISIPKLLFAETKRNLLDSDTNSGFPDTKFRRIRLSLLGRLVPDW